MRTGYVFCRTLVILVVGTAKVGYMGYVSCGGSFDLSLNMIQVLVILCLPGVYMPSGVLTHSLVYSVYTTETPIIGDLYHSNNPTTCTIWLVVCM